MALFRKIKKPIDQYKLTEKVRKDYETERQYKKDSQEIKRLEAQKRYAESRSGRFTSALFKGARYIKSPSRALYRKTSVVPMRGYKAVKGIVRGRGRPVGSYKPENAQYGGVYERRKAEAFERFKMRQEYLRSRAINPNQQMILRQIEAREAAKRQDIEARPIPDTRGAVSLRGINDEIDSAAGLLD